MIEKNKNGIPKDVVEVILFLRNIRYELSDSMKCEVDDLISDLAHDHKKWKFDNAQEPDWNAFRLNINQSCVDDGMPSLFEDQDTEQAIPEYFAPCESFG